MNDTANWETPELKELGKAEDLIKAIDVDGTGDTNFPVNLTSL
tara:strand:- start:192 stop:320 length:129 start_codon:yes stop_codon:yes gene_type:complete